MQLGETNYSFSFGERQNIGTILELVFISDIEGVVHDCLVELQMIVQIQFSTLIEQGSDIASPRASAPN